MNTRYTGAPLTTGCIFTTHENDDEIQQQQQSSAVIWENEYAEYSNPKYDFEMANYAKAQ